MHLYQLFVGYRHEYGAMLLMLLANRAISWSGGTELPAGPEYSS